MVNYSLCELSLHILSVSFLLFKQAFIGKKKFIVALILNSKNFTLSRICFFAGNLYILNVKKDTPTEMDGVDFNTTGNYTEENDSQQFYNFTRCNRNAFNTTDTELKAMAAPANHGARKPIAAIGIPIVL